MPAALPAPAPQEATPPKSKSKRKHSFLKRSHSCDCVPATDLPAEVCALKERLQSSCPAASFRFSFRCMKKVVVPPVTIPSQFSNPRALSTVVAGKKIPATKCMWTNQRHKLIKRMPDRIIEDMRYEEIRYA
ncbi:TPA: hypothetical protein N0F65_007945 [Lagenidium giganteum]|uniref:Uncharacterized protein n=1 Tax=Lagenidium giganteum TaxID=4803 RepID=A0AAV2YCW8_9STRA|nr:TPA: hypothetical protein N0F65_007945 [Lagenidium giganteum]